MNSLPARLAAVASACSLAVLLAGCWPSTSPPARPSGTSIVQPTRQPSPVGQPQLIEEGYRGFNIVQLAERFYGVSQQAGAFTTEAAQRGDYVQAQSLAEARQLIDNQATAQAEREADASPSTPLLVREAYRGYNLVRFELHTYAVRQDGTPFDPTKARTGAYSTAPTPAELRALVDEQATAELEAIADAEPWVPLLVDEDPRGFNVIRLNRRTFAIPRGAGEFDRARFEANGYPNGLEGASAAEIRRRLSGEAPRATDSTPAASPRGTATRVDPSATPGPNTDQATPVSGLAAGGQTGFLEGAVLADTFLRIDPAGPALRLLPARTRVTILGPAEPVAGRTWLQVKTADGTAGWMAAEALTASNRP